MVSPSITRTVKEAATGLANSDLSLGHAWTATKPISKQSHQTRKVARTMAFRIEVGDLEPIRIGPFCSAKFVNVAGHPVRLDAHR
jgi:hypothetical protein